MFKWKNQQVLIASQNYSEIQIKKYKNDYDYRVKKI